MAGTARDCKGRLILICWRQQEEYRISVVAARKAGFDHRDISTAGPWPALFIEDSPGKSHTNTRSVEMEKSPAAKSHNRTDFTT
jgi:hypothetical protein